MNHCCLSRAVKFPNEFPAERGLSWELSGSRIRQQRLGLGGGVGVGTLGLLIGVRRLARSLCARS